MQTFLEETARQLLLNHNTGLADVCVVLPNRRAGIYLKKHISEVAKQTVWAPDIFSIEDFLIKISGYTKPDDVALIFDLYQIHRQIEKQTPQDFDQFARWGHIMLSDFNEIDMHLVDARDLYGYLSKVKAIEKWNPDGRPLTKAENEYLLFYKSLHEYYSLFRKQLQQEKTGYQGLIYRVAAENIAADRITENWQKIYFAGFNALTRAEEKVIYYLKENGLAEILRDADAYYLFDKKQEAGEFLRKQMQIEGRENFNIIGEYYKTINKHIYLHGVPGNAGQAEIAGKILQHQPNDSDIKNGKSNNFDKHTALVLADESLLIPVLHALPKNLNKFNITMGYPLRLTTAYTFVVLLLRLFENTERFKKIGNTRSNGFYHRDILRILQHSLVADFKNISEKIATIKTLKQVFYTAEELLDIFENADSDTFEFIKLLFSKVCPTPGEVLITIRLAIDSLRKNVSVKQDQLKNDTGKLLQLEYLFNVSSLIKRLDELNNKYQSIESIKNLRNVFKQIAAGARLPFLGEPLQGTQIMGMLETRNIDFERVILLSASEGILPASLIGNSLIPYDIQVEMNLPTHKQKNAVFAYHFYRLLQRASEVHIVYNTESNTLGGGEKSRFIYQLINELPQYNPKIIIDEVIENLPPPTKNPVKIIEIPKTDLVYESLLEKTAKGLAPTSLNQYRKCPLQFYFKNVAGLKINDEVEENLEHKTIGSIVHLVLEDLYAPFISKTLLSSDVLTMKTKTKQFMHIAFDKLYGKGQVQFGKNRLIYEVIKNYLNSFLDFEIEELKKLEKKHHTMSVLGLEQALTSENLADHFHDLSNAKVILIGFIDRVDQVDDTVRIIDYKTGKVNSHSELQISDWTDFSAVNIKEKAFQIMMYAWLYNRQSNISKRQLTGGIFSLPILSNGFMKFGIKPGRNDIPDQNINEEKLEAFEQYLMSLLHEILDKSIPFTQTDRSETCRNCDYAGICNK